MRKLELLPPYSEQDVKRAYREQAKHAHPDAGGSPEDFVELHDAYERALDLVTFQGSRRNWIGQRVDLFLARSQLVEQIKAAGGYCQLQPPDAYLQDYGPDFAHILCQLSAVHLTGKTVGDEMLKDLAASPAAAEIQFLDLSESRITDAGLGRLAELRLGGLDLRSTRISLRGLAQLKYLHELEWLHAGKTRIGFWGRRRLRRQFRGLELIVDLNENPPDFTSEEYRRWKLLQRLA